MRLNWKADFLVHRGKKHAAQPDESKPTSLTHQIPGSIKNSPQDHCGKQGCHAGFTRKKGQPKNMPLSTAAASVTSTFTSLFISPYLKLFSQEAGVAMTAANPNRLLSCSWGCWHYYK